MMARLKEDKGSCVWDYLTIDDLINAIFIVKNHELSWTQAFKVKGMCKDEQQKYAVHKKLPTQEEREKYAPKKTRFIKRTKRIFGISTTNSKGNEYYSAAKLIWEDVIKDDQQVQWIKDG